MLALKLLRKGEACQPYLLRVALSMSNVTVISTGAKGSGEIALQYEIELQRDSRI